MSRPHRGVTPPFAMVVLLLLGGIAAGGCRGAGRFLGELLKERPPASLDSLPLASDARIDSAGRLAGSFVGEGTSRAVHLLSSDTAFIAALLRRYRADLASAPDPWAALARARVVTLGGGARRTVGGPGPQVETAVVASPLGHTDVQVEAVLLRSGGRGCGARGAQAELIVADERLRGDPPLRGPVLGSLRTGAAAGRVPERGLLRRDPAPEPSAALAGELVGRTERALDSTLAAGYRSLALAPVPRARLEINTLADVDAADVVAFRVADERIRYAVSLRARRVSARGDTLVGTAVMVWDSAGAWRQDIFRPTLLRLRSGRLAPRESRERPIYWRRLQPISDFAYPRDNLWMEQVDVRDGSVRWGIVQPRGNVVVAAAEVDGPCR
ncbi:MAG: hypothetical protein ABIQ49_13050 [Gemmatimonadales bacterium]